ncbi:MAG TPA: hypothetical protein VF857_02040 [Spirochaetota bacterium]
MKNKSDIASSQRSKARGFSIFGKKLIMTSESTPANISYLPFSHTRELYFSRETLSSAKHFESVREVASPERGKTFVELLSSVIIKTVCSGTYNCDQEGYFCDRFYDACVKEIVASDIADADVELQVIYAKQMMMLLKKCGIVSTDGKKYRVNDHLLSYEKLFNAFWNSVSWNDFFPSMPETAIQMWDERSLLLELLNSQQDVFCVDDLASDYFSDYRKSFKDQLLYISFFDFSFFAWMRNFGIVEYVEENDGRVKARVTSWGKYFISRID